MRAQYFHEKHEPWQYSAWLFLSIWGLYYLINDVSCQNCGFFTSVHEFHWVTIYMEHPVYFHFNSKWGFMLPIMTFFQKLEFFVNIDEIDFYIFYSPGYSLYIDCQNVTEGNRSKPSFWFHIKRKKVGNLEERESITYTVFSFLNISSYCHCQ